MIDLVTLQPSLDHGTIRLTQRHHLNRHLRCVHRLQPHVPKCLLNSSMCLVCPMLFCLWFLQLTASHQCPARSRISFDAFACSLSECFSCRQLDASGQSSHLPDLWMRLQSWMHIRHSCSRLKPWCVPQSRSKLAKWLHGLIAWADLGARERAQERAPAYDKGRAPNGHLATLRDQFERAEGYHPLQSAQERGRHLPAISRSVHLRNAITARAPGQLKCVSPLCAHAGRSGHGHPHLQLGRL